MKTGIRDHSRRGRLFYCLLSLLLALGAARKVQAGSTTTVQDVVYRADGTAAKGTLVISWGNSELARVANNYFGIKARRDHPSKPNAGLPGTPAGGDAIELPTVEYVDGAPVRIPARFAKYSSMTECFADRDRMIASLPAYQEACVAAGDPEAFVRALARHWATDPGYAEKVLYLYRAHGFDRLDHCWMPSTE